MTTISDQGREFVNQLNDQMMNAMRTEHRIASAYHPQTNGQVERFNQTLKRSLMKLVNDNQDDWDLLIDPVLFGYWVARQASTRYAPFYLMYGRKALLPVEI